MTGLKALGGLLIWLGFVLLSFSPLYASEILHLKADSFRYTESKKVMVASSNVSLSIDDVAIKAPLLFIDVDKKAAWGKGDVRLERGNKTVFAESVYFDLEASVATLNGAQVQIEIPDSKAPVYLTADDIIDTPHVIMGKNGFITTCSLDKPHYHFKARTFQYYPDKRIVGKHVTLDFPLWMMPFGLYSPYYRFELGKRDIIWNFPSIGEKKTDGWGWFMQNTIDYGYMNGKESSVLVDLFENKGVGLGVDHQYRFNDEPGHIYAYYLREADTKTVNYKWSWDGQFRLNNFWRLKANYGITDAERINSRGRVRTESKGFDLLYQDVGDKWQIKGSNAQNFVQQYQNNTLYIGRNINHTTPYTFSINQSQNLAAGSKYTTSTLTHNHHFPWDSRLTNTFSYSGQKNQGAKLDDRLRSTTALRHTFNKNLSMKIEVDHLFDLDGSRVTQDSFSNANNFFFKQPEVTFSYTNNNFFKSSLKSKYVVARYQEVQYNQALNQQISFPQAEDYDLLPNTYIMTQSLDRTFSKLPGNGAFKLHLGYEQYIFKTPDRSLFDGDALYKLTFKPSYTVTFGQFLKTETAYNWKHIPEEGNSPFLSQFRDDTIGANSLTETLTFYYKSIDKYYWRHQTGYDFQRKRWDPYLSKIHFSPSPKFVLDVESGADINRLNEYLNYRNSTLAELGVFRPLDWTATIKPITDTTLRFYHSQNLNSGLINQSNFVLNVKMGQSKDYRWDFQGTFVYDTNGQLRHIEADRYDLETFSLLRTDHCRSMKISYNRRREEIKVLFTILAFPNDSFGYSKSRDVSKFEGFFDDSSKERF